MARNGSGTYSLPAVTAPPSAVASSTTVNGNMDDIATALTESINIAGTKAWAGNQSVGGFKLTSLGAGSVRTDSVNFAQAQDSILNWVDGGGTADAITATYSPAITALVDGQICYVRATAANTITAPTFSPNGLTARIIYKNGAVALAVGDIAGDNHELQLKYHLASTRWELLNPALNTASASVSGIVELATTTEVLTGTDAVRAVTPDAAAALWEAGADIADGATITIGEGGYFNLITSTTAITAFTVTTSKAGRTFRCRFNTARTLTHNATSLILPGGVNITTAQGDIAQFRDLAGGNVVCEWYTKASGVAASQKWKYIETLSPSGVANTVSTITLAGYTAVRITGINIMPADDGVQGLLRISSDGVTYLSANYSSVGFHVITGSGAGSETSTAAFTFLDLVGTTEIGNASGDGGLDFEVLLTSFGVAQKTKAFGSFAYGDTAAALKLGSVIGWQTAQTAMTHVQFLFSGGNIASGTIVIEAMI